MFSLNKLQKYPKDSYNNTDSLWCYKDYGPCFHWDLYFRENKIHAVKYEKKNYLTPEKWIDKKNCYVNEEGILLDSLEVFQIINVIDKIPSNKGNPFLFGNNVTKINHEKKNSDKQIINEKNDKNINENENNKSQNKIEENKNDIKENKNDIEENKNNNNK